ncbi:class I SAM-dependent methyltransferase [Cronbergia sp. UHCC 0137]|uniref:class I SAM-dependent methyltransferase n=1 Tax=Cronbergia sp. UHCC 0137 TaxID=3110239 RepID=UPI002B20D19E|nr:class I SAM-dependent methyltransferase [Cronbergia sp. UHCC 0137]MEA5617105.1 class I SAM-dependent methyltransferase [Cronbergia sp. UHCC 0137]
MTTTVTTTPDLASRLVNGVLAIKPLFNLAKYQARQMMIKRAKRIGVPWMEEFEHLQARNWEDDLTQVQNSQLTYPEYYLRPFHAYENGDLSWQAAFELEVAARTVHASIWPEAGVKGDAQLRQSYHDILKTQVPQPQDILDLGCAVGLSTFTLQAVYPQAKVTGLDLSPYFLAVANYRSQQRQANINWVHAQAESTGLPDQSFDLVSTFLVCHELPQLATHNIFAEVRRLLRPGGYLAIMDMNPKSEIYKKMPTYILTLLKSTEPYLDEYFALDIEETLIKAGFQSPTITSNSPRHRTIIARTGE